MSESINGSLLTPSIGTTPQSRPGVPPVRPEWYGDTEILLQPETSHVPLPLGREGTPVSVGVRTRPRSGDSSTHSG